MSASLFTVPDVETDRLLKLIASYSGVKISTKVQDTTDTTFKGSDGKPVTGTHTAARHIASLSSKAAQLLGQSPEQQAKISEWLSFKHTSLTPVMDDKLAQLNNALQASNCLGSSSMITLADLVVYATVSSAVLGFPVAQHAHFCNLIRWYDYVNHVADADNVYPVIVVAKPRFAPPPPQQLAAKEKAAAAAANGGEGKQANAKPADAATATASKDSKKTKGREQPATPAPSTEEGAAAGSGGNKKKEKKQKDGTTTKKTDASASSAPAPAVDGSLPVDILDMRVGKIVKVGPHPNADSLYLEEIDLGEPEGPRQVISGLVKFVPIEKMQNRMVVVVCNLKPAKMRDVMSYGMVMCASNDAHDQVDPVNPPEGAVVGEKISFEGYTNAPEAQLNPKKKQLEKVLPFLVTDKGKYHHHPNHDHRLICTYACVCEREREREKEREGR
jgi:aminoacyl tRNA synthase complex-interacting multifunctional protein 1